MERRCSECGVTYDDDSALRICPHTIGERAVISPMNPSIDALNDLIYSELEDLIFENPGVFFSHSPLSINGES